MTTDARGPRYELVLRGEVGDRFEVLFDDMRLTRSRGNTVLTGRIRDQAQLHGFIERIQELGLELVSVNQIGEPRPQEARIGLDHRKDTP